MRWPGAGFSLIELTVVLVLVSLIGGLVLPGLSGAYQSFSARDAHERMLMRLGSLGYQAYSQGRAIQIVTNDDAVRHLSPPAGWSIEVVEPVEVTHTGVCLRGEIVFVKDELRWQVRVDPPFCWKS